MKIGLKYKEALSLPFGELLDLIAVQEIKEEGAKYKKNRKDEETEFWDFMDKE